MPPTFVVQRDTPINSPLTDWIDEPVSVIYDCNGADNLSDGYVPVESKKAMTTGKKWEGYTVFKTSHPGVGLVIRARSQGSGGLSDYYDFPYGRWISSLYLGKHTLLFGVGGRYIKIGDLANADNPVNPVNVGEISVISNDSKISNTVLISSHGSVLYNTACSVNSPIVNVNMGNYTTTQFKGINTTTSSKDIPISLDCDFKVRINATVIANSDPSTSQPGAIKLSSGGAKGIAVQLLDKNGAGIKLNSKFFVDYQENEGQYSLNWKARYLQTEESVAVGDANAVATLSLTYE